MSTSYLRRTLRVGGAAAVLGILSAASAELIGPAMTIIVSDGQGHSAMYTYHATQGADGNWSFNNSVPYEMYDQTSGLLLATLNPPALVAQGQSCSALYVADPIVNLNFAVQAGPFTPTTTIMIASAILDHDDIVNGQGRASAGITLTDGDGNGAQLLGIGDPNGAQGAYLAQYNGFAGTISGTTFAELHPQLSAAPGGSNSTINNDVPPVGFNPIPGTVMDMSSFISFTLTRNDLASGTSNFEVIPEPASLALLLIGAALIRRRS